MGKWKITLGLLAAVTLGSSYGVTTVRAESQIQLNYNDIGLGSKQIIMENTTYIPLKSLADAMGYTLSWNQPSKTAKLVRPQREVVINAGSKSSQVNGTIQALTKPPRIIKGSVYVPLVSAVNVLGGKVGVDKQRDIQIIDDTRYVTASDQGRSYWISQKNGDLYYRDLVAGKPVNIGKLPLTGSAYNHSLKIKSLANGTDLLQLTDNHYAMFNDFSNSYQVLVQSGAILKQMAVHYITASYQHAPQVPSTQLYMIDGKNVQYITKDGQLGKLYELEKLTGATGDFAVEYAAADVMLVRSLNNTQLFVIDSTTAEATNLSEHLISKEDRKEWDRVNDGSDPYILTKMLVLKSRNGNVLTFNYTPLIEGTAKKVTYTLVTK